MNNHYYYVEVEDAVQRRVLGEGIKMQILIYPSFFPKLETRSLDQVLDATSVEGHEVRYCSRITTPNWINRRIDSVVLRFLERAGYTIKNQYDVSIEPVGAIRVL